MTKQEMQARFQRALDHAGNTHTVDDVLRMLDEGTAKCWTEGDGIIITTIDVFPREQAVHYWLAAGNLRDCLALEEQINRDSIDRGCTIATVTGRRGWGPYGAKTGWKLRGHLFGKRLAERIEP